MKRARLRLLLSVFLIFLINFSSASTAKEFGTYDCVIERTYSLSETGEMLAYKNQIWAGDKFTIDKTTGRATGTIKNFNLTQYGNFQPMLVDAGSDDQYFKVVTLYGSDKPSIQTIRVQEWSDNKEKPFYVAHGGTINTGLCINQ